ncbi:MAG: caspase family protein [Candidatus Thorarchaeota archaeon]
MSKALCIGINDYKSVTKLRGCVNDAKELARSLKDSGVDEVRLITDTRADRKNILKRLKWAVSDTDFYVVTFSGHGTQMRDRDGDELKDFKDELICPYDKDPSSYWDTGMIKDDEWKSLLPDGVNGFVLFDCCHSGTGLRNPHGLKPELTDLEIVNRSVEPPVDILWRDNGTNGAKTLVAPFSSNGMANKPIVFIAASKDSQTAADYFERDCGDCGWRGGYHGALSYAFLQLLKGWREGADWTYGQLNSMLKSKLEAFTQVPSVECMPGVDNRVNEATPLFSGLLSRG